VPDGVEATARNGNLTLTGTVSYGAERTAAQDTVAGLIGVRNLSDDIAIGNDADPVDVTGYVQGARGMEMARASRGRGPRATASVRPCAPSLAERWRTCVRTVCTDRDSSRAMSGVDKFVGMYRSTRISPWLSGSVSRRPIPQGYSGRRGSSESRDVGSPSQAEP
jgi:hypothetical protein